MPACSAYGCTSRPSKKIPGITFHRFPKDEYRRAQWIIAVRRKNWMPSKISVLCSNHFTEDMMDRTSVTTVRVRSNAVPTVFSYSSDFKKSKKHKSCIMRITASSSEVLEDIDDPLPVVPIKDGINNSGLNLFNDSDTTDASKSMDSSDSDTTDASKSMDTSDSESEPITRNKNTSTNICSNENVDHQGEGKSLRKKKKKS